MQGKKAEAQWIDIPVMPTDRPTFTDGSRLERMAIPPHMAGDLEHIAAFWKNTFWSMSEEQKPTTWLDFVLCYRFMGGGSMHHQQEHAVRQALATQLKQFTSASKQFLRCNADPSTINITCTHKGRAMLLARYGILLHMPAIESQLCLAPHIREAIHSMLITARHAKHGIGQHMLKASAKPLPKLEPWVSYVGKAPQTLPPTCEHCAG